MVDGFAKTPHYVLRDGSHPTCPSLCQASLDGGLTVIFGFSDKPQYDAFLAASTLALTPYPLVKGYLLNQVAINVDSLKLVVLDAVSSQQPTLYAATFQSVLESIQMDLENVAVSHQLILEKSSLAYQVKSFAVDTVA